ncbi:MAG TPA: hypothetical protein DDZ81_07885 [Acetobacteraceae bacterium]|jgi:hypothetical protein|nr:hypothetical protein [Acetobacteraceae bacterium]
MTPSQTIIHEATRTFAVTDTKGRSLLLRRLTALDTLRLFKAAGPELAQNEAWLGMAGLAFSVVEISGVPIPAPKSEAQIEGIIERLGDEGLAAIASALKPNEADPTAGSDVGNSLGTPS